jgi:hypothetical protein
MATLRQRQQDENRRWLLNDRESTLHNRINNRGIMADTHNLVTAFIYDPENSVDLVIKKRDRGFKGNVKHCIRQTKKLIAQIK